ncbi:MAG TPA: hypothetical protein VKV03_12525 [Candidatus Binataceae bacterium]|nr:hypothetical protein [Candidatus Binataceae bacterium]
MRDSRNRIFAVLLCAGFLLLAAEHSVHALEFPPSDFDILSADNGELIGHAHYTLEQTPGAMTLRGESHYLNGEYDIEENTLAGSDVNPLPPLLSFKHDFFDPSGALTISGRLDTQTGLGTCGKADASGAQDLTTEGFDFPADTYAGSSVLLPIQNFVGRGNRGEVLKLHVFNCAPTPKLIAVDVKPQAQPQTWADYPGELERTDIRANFGFWTVLIKPFIPKLAAWFDPSQNMLLVGAQLERYYKGPKIILVRKREAIIIKEPPPSSK